MKCLVIVIVLIGRRSFYKMIPCNWSSGKRWSTALALRYWVIWNDLILFTKHKQLEPVNCLSLSIIYLYTARMMLWWQCDTGRFRSGSLLLGSVAWGYWQIVQLWWTGHLDTCWRHPGCHGLRGPCWWLSVYILALYHVLSMYNMLAVINCNVTVRSYVLSQMLLIDHELLVIRWCGVEFCGHVAAWMYKWISTAYELIKMSQMDYVEWSAKKQLSLTKCMGIRLLYHRPSMWATNKILTELDDTLTDAVEEYTT